MLALLPYIEKAMVLANLTSSGYGSRKSAVESCFVWIAIGLFAVSYVFIIGGLGLFLVASYELPVALMVTGLVILFTVLSALAATRLYKKMRARRVKQGVKSVADEATQILSAIGNEVGGAFKDNAALIAVMVAGIGFLAARKIF